MKKSPALLMAVLISALAGRVHAQGNLVVNGSFDTDASGWSVNNVSSQYDGKRGNPPGSFILYDTPSVLTDPTISQTVNGLIPSTTYMTSGDYQLWFDGDGGSPTEFSFGVALDGVYLFEALAPQDFDWHHFSFLYTAASPSAVLSIAAQRNGTRVDYSIDNIVIQVPEPSSAGLLGLGAAAFAILVRRRRSS